MKPLTKISALILILLMSVGGAAWAQEVCSDRCPWIVYDRASCMQACRCANALETIAKNMEK